MVMTKMTTQKNPIIVRALELRNADFIFSQGRSYREHTDKYIERHSERYSDYSDHEDHTEYSDHSEYSEYCCTYTEVGPALG